MYQRYHNRKSEEQFLKELEEERKTKVSCPKCKHIKRFYEFENRTYKICEYCGTKVYKNKFEEFKDKLSKERRKNYESINGIENTKNI